MAHSNVSVFVAHVGCPNLCSFCNQHTISGSQTAPTVEEVRATCEEALRTVKDRANTEVAFFGGSFTAIERSYMVSLLECVQDYVGEGRFSGIRVSTRPDRIDSEVLDTLKAYRVTAIELGCQSMRDSVLAANRRGHSSQDVVDACRLIRSYGFELGLQTMLGLYTSTLEDEYYTARRVVELRPDTVRVYPTVVLKGTHLDELMRSGEYRIYPLDTMVEVCADLLTEYEAHGIRVIKCGLHASELVESEATGGYYHPAFRELCESRVYRKAMERLIEEHPDAPGGEYRVSVAKRYLSTAIGQKRANVEYFRSRGVALRVLGVDGLAKYDCELVDP